MSSPQLSVIFSCRDRHAELNRSLTSWRNQDSTDIEVELIVVDDGSNPPLREIAAAHNAVYMTIPPNPARGGPTMAWNAGLRAAHGEVLACSSPEIIPDKRCARFLYDIPMGRGGFFTYVAAKGDIKHPERLKDRAIKVSVPMFYLTQEHNPDSVDWRSDPDHLRELPNFWGTSNPQLSNWTNRDVTTRGWMPNALFSMRANLWAWMSYLRPTENWGAEDIELVTRRHHLGITVVAATDTAYCYHQYHDARFRTGQSDLHEYNNTEEARLVWLYPDTANTPCPLRNNWDYSDLFED